MSNLYSPIKMILADDHELLRDGFSVMMKKIPEIDLVGEAENGMELIRLARRLHPDVIVTDIKMPVMNGIEATRELMGEFPHLGIIALSMFDEENLIVDMLEAGAKGYLLKNAQKDEIITAIKAVYNDQNYFCRNTSTKLAGMIANNEYIPLRERENKPEFSEKEICIIKMICNEFSNLEIGNHLQLSKRTIEGYRENILRKMNAKNTAGIVVYAMKNKIFK